MTIASRTGSSQKLFLPLLFGVLTLGFAALYIAVFMAYAETGAVTATTVVNGATALRALVALLLLGAACLLLSDKRVADWLFRYRYLVGVALVALACIANVSGSSVGMWADRLGYDNQGLLFGTPRDIRTDEWAVLTPFFSAQRSSGFPLVSDIIRGTETVTSVVYALPSWSLSILYHPFLAGFLFLGFERGLAFFWSARLIAMFLATFELGRLVTKDRRGLALVLAALVTFSSRVQWWYAVNGTADLFGFGCALVVVLDQFLRTPSSRAKWGLALTGGWLAGCYLWILYPAWQITLFYVFALLGIWVVVRWKREGARFFVRQNTVPLAVTFLATGLLCGICAWQGWDAIYATIHTVYPGAREETGGDNLQLLVQGFYGYTLPLGLRATGRNLCSAAPFFVFCPVGVVMGSWAAVKKRDGLSIALLALVAVLVAYMVVGFPLWLAKATLLSSVPSYRCLMAAGFAEVLLLVRGIGLMGRTQERPRPGRAWAPAVVSIALIVIATPFVSRLSAIPAVVLVCLYWVPCALVFAAFTTGLTSRNERVGRGVLLAALVLAVLPGALVNPVQQGTYALTGSDDAQLVRGIATDDPDALWACEGRLLGQFTVANGAATINSVNVYPDLARWELLDPTGEYEDVYNRYAHIAINIQDTGPTTIAPEKPDSTDSFVVSLAFDDVKTLGIGYYVSQRDMTQLNSDTVKFVPIAPLSDGWYIFRVE